MTYTQQDKASLVLVGGVETFSDVPIRLSRPLRQTLITLPKVIHTTDVGDGHTNHLCEETR